MSDVIQVASERAERDVRIYARRIEGLTFAVIAREFSLNHETVRVIFRRMERIAQRRNYKSPLLHWW
jgi:hypothetical protein